LIGGVPWVTSKGLCQQESGAEALKFVLVVEDGEEDTIHGGSILEGAMGLVRRRTSRKRRSMGAVTGTMVSPEPVRLGAGLLLIGWAIYEWRFGHRHRVRVGLQTGLAGLAVWPALMATAHGAGLMLWPALMPLCFPDSAALDASGPFATALLGVGLHTAAMLVVTALVAATVYEWAGLEFLRRGWLNMDAIWRWALVLTGAILLAT
jgi:hypothetical protein